MLVFKHHCTEERPWIKHSVLRRGAVTQWDTYFHQYEPVYTKVPVMMCPGCVHPFKGGQATFKPRAASHNCRSLLHAAEVHACFCGCMWGQQ